MTESMLNLQKNEMAINYIAELLEQLTVDYKNTKTERKNIAALFPNSEEEFSILEEMELLTVDIRGYGSQIQARGRIEDEQKAIEQLQMMGVFGVPAIADFYFTTNGEYPQIKAYIQKLDYLRLLMLEYLRSRQQAIPAEIRAD